MHVSICVYTCLFRYYIRVCLYLNSVCIRVCLCKMVLRLLWFCCEGVFLTEQNLHNVAIQLRGSLSDLKVCTLMFEQDDATLDQDSCWEMLVARNPSKPLTGDWWVFHGLSFAYTYFIYNIYICILENDEHAHMDWSKKWFKCERHAVIMSILNVTTATTTPTTTTTTTTHQDKHTQKIQGIAPECFVYSRFVFVWRLRNPKSTHLPTKNEKTNKNQHMRNTLSLFVYMFLPWEMQNLGSPSFPR